MFQHEGPVKATSKKLMSSTNYDFYECEIINLINYTKVILIKYTVCLRNYTDFKFIYYIHMATV